MVLPSVYSDSDEMGTINDPETRTQLLANAQKEILAGTKWLEKGDAQTDTATAKIFYQEALDNFKSAIGYNPLSEFAHENLYKTYYKLGDVSQGDEVFSKMVKDFEYSKENPQQVIIFQTRDAARNEALRGAPQQTDQGSRDGATRVISQEDNTRLNSLNIGNTITFAETGKPEDIGSITSINKGTGEITVQKFDGTTSTVPVNSVKVVGITEVQTTTNPTILNYVAAKGTYFQLEQLAKRNNIPSNVQKSLSQRILSLEKYRATDMTSPQNSAYIAFSYQFTRTTNNPEVIQTLSQSTVPTIRKGIAENANTPSNILSTLAKDSESDVQIAVAKNKRTPEADLNTLAKSDNEVVKNMAKLTLRNLETGTAGGRTASSSGDDARANGDTAYNQGKYEDAVNYYQQALKEGVDGNDYLLNWRLAASYSQLKEYNQALDYYSRSIKLNPGLSSPYNNRGVIYYNLKDYEKAMGEFKEAMNRGDTSAKSNLKLALEQVVAQARLSTNAAEKKQKYELAQKYIDLIDSESSFKDEIRGWAEGGSPPPISKPTTQTAQQILQTLSAPPSGAEQAATLSGTGQNVGEWEWARQQILDGNVIYYDSDRTEQPYFLGNVKGYNSVDAYKKVENEIFGYNRDTRRLEKLSVSRIDEIELNPANDWTSVGGELIPKEGTPPQDTQPKNPSWDTNTGAITLTAANERLDQILDLPDKGFVVIGGSNTYNDKNGFKNGETVQIVKGSGGYFYIASPDGSASATRYLTATGDVFRADKTQLASGTNVKYADGNAKPVAEITSVPAGSLHVKNARGQIINPEAEPIIYNKATEKSMKSSDFEKLSPAGKVKFGAQDQLVTIPPSSKWDPATQTTQLITIVGGRSLTGQGQLPAAQPQIVYDYDSGDIEDIETGTSTRVTISQPDENGFRAITRTENGQVQPSTSIDQRLLDPTIIAGVWNGDVEEDISLNNGDKMRLGAPVDNKITSSTTTSVDQNTITARSVPDVNTDITRQTTNDKDNKERQVTETTTRSGETITAATAKGITKDEAKSLTDDVKNEIPLSQIESLSITTAGGTSTMRNSVFTKISSDREVLLDVLREGSLIGMDNIIQPIDGKIGSGDTYIMINKNGQEFSVVKNGKLIRQVHVATATSSGQLVSSKRISEFNGDVKPSLDRNEAPIMQEESVERTYDQNYDGSTLLTSMKVMRNDGKLTQYSYSTTRANVDGKDVQIVIAKVYINNKEYTILSNNEEHRNPRSHLHNARGITGETGCINSNPCYIRGSDLYREQTIGYDQAKKSIKTLVPMSKEEIEKTGISKADRKAWEDALNAEAEADNRLTAAQENHQAMFQRWGEVTGTAISTGNFYIYFMGKVGLGDKAQDAMQWWTDKLEASNLGFLIQQDPIGESVCNGIDGVKGLETKLPGTDQGNYYAVTPQGFITAGAFINPTKQEILVPDPDDQSKPITKYNYIIDFKVNLDIPKDPTAAYQDPQIRDKVGVNLAVRLEGVQNLFPTYLLKAPGSTGNAFIEVQRGTTYYYQDADGKHLGPVIIAESSKNFEEACIIFDRRPFFSVGFPETNLQRYGLYAVCIPFKIVGEKDRTVEQATQDIIKSKKDEQKESERISPGAAVANDDVSLY